MKRFMVRQGDVMIIQVSETPVLKNDEKKDDQGRVILAAGEATGHHHAIRHPGATIYAVEENLRILKLEEAALLEHEEHSAIQLPAGTFQVIRQVEYTPQRIVTVAD